MSLIFVAYKKSHLPNLGPLLQGAATAAQDAFIDAMDAHAEDVRVDFVDRIKENRFASFRVNLYPTGDPDNLNLSPQWVGRKRAKGADLRTMIATGNYVNSIKVNRRLERRRTGGLWRVGFDSRKRARDLDGQIVDFTLNDVAMVHEHGNTKTPRRPHWGPNLRRLQREAPKVRQEMALTLGMSLKKATRGKFRVTVGGKTL